MGFADEPSDRVKERCVLLLISKVRVNDSDTRQMVINTSTAELSA
jgi:hypothetical protein